MRTRTLLLSLPLLLITPADLSLGAEEGAAPEETRPPVKVTLEDAGESPKAALRYSPSVGDLQTIVLSLSTSVTTQMANLAMPPMKMPTTVSTLTVRIDDVSEGRIAATVRIDEAKLADTEGVQPMIVKQIESTVKGSVGQSAKLVVSDRGIGQSFSFNEDAKADPAAAQVLASLESALAMLSTPLPEEPIGPGARWTAESTIDEQLVSVVQKVTYTLTSVSDDVLKIERVIEHSAPEQEMSMQGAPPGTKVKLTSLSLEGTSSATVDLKRIEPTEADLSSTAVQEFDLTQSNVKEPQHYTQTMDAHVTVKERGQKAE